MDEYIELNAAIAKIDPDEYYHSNEVKDILRDVPAADVEPVRHAYWVPEERVDRISEAVTYRNTRYLCSACGRALVAWEKPIDAPYCHCGAKMDGKKEKLEKLLHANFREPDVNVRIEYEDSNTERG